MRIERGVSWGPVALAALLGLMASLKVYTLHTAYYDLGVFEHALWGLAFREEWRWLFCGHVQMFLPLDAVLYRVFPAGYVLVLKQAAVIGASGWLVCALADRPHRPLVLAAYALFFPVWYLGLFDYHPEHMVIPLGLAFYLAAFRKRPGWAFACAVGVALTKEPYALAGIFCGIYLALRFRAWRWGLATALVCFAIFYLDKAVLLPAFTHGVDASVYRSAYTWMGSSLSGILVYVLTHPIHILTDILTTPGKLLFLGAGLAALAFVPLLSPLELIPAIPMLAISLLAHNENYYGLGHHYTAGLVAPYCAAFCLALPRLESWAARLGARRGGLLVAVVGCMLAVHVVLSPSPVSRLFWSDKVWSYGYGAYLPEARDSMIKQAIAVHIPMDPTVSIATSNTLMTSVLAHRDVLEVFPRGVTQPAAAPDMAAGGMPLAGRVDYLVLDLRRPWYLVGDGCRWRTGSNAPLVGDNPWLRCAPTEFQQQFWAALAAARTEFDTVYENEGFMICRRRSSGS